MIGAYGPRSETKNGFCIEIPALQDDAAQNTYDSFHKTSDTCSWRMLDLNRGPVWPSGTEGMLKCPSLDMSLLGRPRHSIQSVSLKRR